MSIFKNNWYYHQTTKAFITAFGSVFDQMSIKKINSNGQVMQDYVVPVDFAPKNKWVSMVSERPDFTTTQVQITLPRMAFEITDMQPNMQRKLGFNGTFMVGNLPDGRKTKLFNPTPIDLTVKLYALTKDNEDMYQIVEQILPYFQPHLTINFNLLPEYNIHKDVPISLVGYEVEDTYTNAVDEQRMITSTFTFKVPLYYFPPTSGVGKIITDVRVGVFTDAYFQGMLEQYEAIIQTPVQSGAQGQSSGPISNGPMGGTAIVSSNGISYAVIEKWKPNK